MTGISSTPETSTADAATVAGFDAFISYSRKDIVFARALEKALKAYRPPRDLGLPERHLRVFRDEADFTGGEYTEAIRKHLGAARKLIVLSSPAARASRYVDEEVRLFAELRGTDSIVPVLLSGIPNNEATAGDDANLAFPESLCRVMPVPLAADYRGFDPAKPRPNRGAHESAWFKLLADVYGVERSAIEQREKRRQATVRRRWIGGTAAVMASLVALTVWALISRAEAIRQGDIAAASLVTAQARMLNGAEIEVVERQALLAIEAIRRLRARGVSSEEAEAVLSTALERLPRRVHTFPPQAHAPAVAFSSDGLRMFRAAGASIEVWNLRLMKIDKAIDVPRPATRLDVSADGRWLAAIDSDGAVSTLSVGEPSVLAASADPAPKTPAISGSLCGAFSASGSLYATLTRTASGGLELVVWQTNSGDIVGRLPIADVPKTDPESQIRPRLAFSPLSRTMFDSAPAAVLVTFAGRRERRLSAMAWIVPPASSGGSAARDSDKASTRRWDDVMGAAFASDGERLVLTRAAENPEQGELLAVSMRDWKETATPRPRVGGVSPDGRRFLTFRGTPEDPYIRSMSGISIEVRDTDDGGVRFELASFGAFSADSDRYLALSDRLVRVFDLDTGVETVRLHTQRPIASVVDSRGGRYLAVRLEDQSIEIWDTGHPQELIRVGSTEAPKMSARGRFAMLKGPYGTRLLDIANGRSMTRLMTPEMDVLGMAPDPAVSPDGTRAVIDAGVNEKRLVDLTRPGHTLWQGTSFKTAAFSPDGSVVVVPVSNQLVRGIRAADGKELWQLPADWVDNLTFGPAGNEVAIAGTSGTMLVDAATGAIRERVKARTSSAVTDASRTRFAVATDEKLTIANLTPEHRTIELVHPKTMSDVAGVAFMPDGRRLATIAGHKEYVEGSFMVPGQFTELAAFVWDLESRSILARIPPGTDRATNFEETLQEDDKAYLAQPVLSRDGRALGATLFRSRGDYWTVLENRAQKDAVVWDLMGTLPREIWRQRGAEMKGLSDAGDVAMVATPRTVHVWSLDRSNLAVAACERVSRDLNATEWQEYFGDLPYRATCNKTR